LVAAGFADEVTAVVVDVSTAWLNAVEVLVALTLSPL
jgi:hypothetical protein